MTRKDWIRAATALLAVAAVAALVWRVNAERRRGFEEVVAAVKSGTLRPNRRGVVALPRRWAGLTSGNVVFVNRSHGRLMVLFPVTRGRDANLTGQLYVDRPLDGSVLERDGYGETVIDFLIGDRIPGNIGEPVTITVDGHSGPHWYSVHRSLD